MRTRLIIASVAATLALTDQAVAQAVAEPTPEAASRFIDTVLVNGVARIIYLDSPTQYAGGYAPVDVRTADCRTVATTTSGTIQRIIEIDWRSYVVADPFPSPGVTDRPAVRVLAKTTVKFVMPSSGTRTTQSVGVAVEPGTEELKDRLIRAMAFYGKFCAPALDGPF